MSKAVSCHVVSSKNIMSHTMARNFFTDLGIARKFFCKMLKAPNLYWEICRGLHFSNLLYLVNGVFFALTIHAHCTAHVQCPCHCYKFITTKINVINKMIRITLLCVTYIVARIQIYLVRRIIEQDFTATAHTAWGHSRFSENGLLKNSTNC